MYKQSRYNIIVPYNSNEVLIYNSLRNSVCLLSTEELSILRELLKDTDQFFKLYPALFHQMKEDGYIVDVNFDELEYIKFQNKIQVFGNTALHITINPTLDCNLSCWYCSTEYAKAKHKGYMSQETVEAVKKHIKLQIERNKISALHLDWFGGEPLMYFNEVIKPIASFAKELCIENNIPFTQHATTNSVLMNSSMMIEMNKLGFTSFQIPIDGNEQHHNSIKYTKGGQGTFFTVVKNLNELPIYIPNIHITLRINYDRKTLFGISDIVPMLSKQAKQHITVDFQKVWQVKCTEAICKQLSLIKKSFYENGLDSEYWAYRPHMFHRCYSDKLRQYAINYDGRIFKCTAQDYGDDKSIGKLNADGTLSLKEQLISKLFSTEAFENDRCLNCNKLPICMGPCIIRNFEFRKQGAAIPCIMENSQFPFESFVKELAWKRGIIKNYID
jgi:uncharacterized protein